MSISKHTGALIGAAGVVLSALVATLGNCGGGGGPPTVVVVPGPTPAPVQPANPPANPTGSPGTTAPPVTPPVQPPAVTAIHFRIHDVITPGFLKEAIIVYIDDVPVGTLSVDLRNPSAAIKVKVPKAGTYRYRLDAAAQFYDEFGDLDDDSATGSGTIKVADGDEFEVALAGTPQAPKIFLQKR